MANSKKILIVVVETDRLVPGLVTMVASAVTKAVGRDAIVLNAPDANPSTIEDVSMSTRTRGLVIDEVSLTSESTWEAIKAKGWIPERNTKW